MDYLNDGYEGKSIELNNIREFEENYSSDKALLLWYMKELFFL